MIPGFKQGVNEICALLGFYAAPIGSFLPMFRDNDGGEILTAVLKIQSSETLPPVKWSIYLHLQGQQFKMTAVRSTETSVTLHQPTGRNYHQHLCENVMSQNRIQAELSCMTRLLRICEDRRTHKSPLLDIFFIPCIIY